MCRVEDKKLSYGSCPASGGAELYTAATQNEILCLKQTSEKGQAHFRDMFPDRCMLAFQFRCWKRLPLSPLVVLQSDWRRGCEKLLSSCISLHTLLCNSPDRMRWEKWESVTKRYRVVMASLCRQFPTKNQSSIGFLFHQSALFCSRCCMALKLCQREHDQSCFLYICNLNLFLLHNKNIIHTGVMSRRTSAEPQGGPYEKKTLRERELMS